MRRHQQRQILELIKTLFEANDEIKRLFSRRDISSITQLLADSQEFVLQVGAYIEELEGEGTRTVTLLEDLHEDLYNASVELSVESPTNASIKRLREQIIDIETSVKTDLNPNKIEVVFLPYKASMWDSLESVWLAAKDDPQCDAYVVPIPYYERENEKGLGKMYYEGGDYPDYVPVTDWLEYDIEERHPDVVFIHYAYDDMTQNYSVHPNFFSKNLKPHCEQLIYIPYYVQSGTYVPEYNGYLPGIVNADFVIVQSEEVRQGFIKQYRKYYDQNKHLEKLKKPEDKFIALGSPKLDKVISSKREDFELPEKWAKLIFKPDGTIKKIILYNTHMFKWIDGGEEYFKKLQYVFETFREHDDVVLWWRPHPSTEQNFRTLKPELLDEYYRVIDEYRNEGFGIYDDTPDLHRAIAWSDAYYGDGSSLVKLIQDSGKPVMVQDVKLLNTDNLIFPHNFYDDGEYLWFASVFINGLFKIDKQTFKMTYLGSFPDEEMYTHLLYYGVAEKDGKLYFAPYDAKEMAVYDFYTCEFAKIPLRLNEIGIDPHSKGKFLDIYFSENNLLITPFNSPAIVIYNITSGYVSHVTEWVTPLKNAAVDNGAFFARPIRGESSLIIPACITGGYMEYDLLTGNYEVKILGDGTTIYGANRSTAGTSLFVPTNGDAPVLELVDGQLNELSSFPTVNHLNEHSRYRKYIPIQGRYFCFPVKADLEAVIVDAETGTVEVIKELSQYCREINPNSMWYASSETLSFSIESGGIIYAYNLQSGKMLAYDPYQRKVLRAEKLFMDEENTAKVNALFALRLNNREQWNKGQTAEHSTQSLMHYLCWICSDAHSLKQSAVKLHKEDVGQKILKYVKTLVI